MKNNVAKNAHKHGHAHHKAEMEHHKLRDSHKVKNKVHHEKNSADAKPPKEENDNHQEGIERVKMKPGQLDINQHGSMADGWRHERHKE